MTSIYYYAQIVEICNQEHEPSNDKVPYTQKLFTDLQVENKICNTVVLLKYLPHIQAWDLNDGELGKL